MKIKNKRLKTLSMVMAMVLTISNVLPLFTYAESTTKNSIGSVDMEDDGITIGVDETQSQKTTYSEELEILTEEDQTQGADVYVSQASTFGVFIPKVLTLDGKKNDDGLNKANYLVSVSESSNFAGNEKIKVVPEDSFVLHQLGKEDIQATVVQDKVEWLHNEIDIKGNGEVTATGMSAGSWNGVFYFNIKLENASNVAIPNTISLSEKELMLGSGDLKQVNATMNGQNINTLATWTSDNENILVEDGLIETKASAQVGDKATIEVSMPIPSEQAKGFDSIFLKNVYAEEVATASLVVEVIDIQFTTLKDGQEEIITSIDIQPGSSKQVNAKVISTLGNPTVSWSTTAISGVNLVKKGNQVTIKIASDMPIDSTHNVIANCGNLSKLLTINVVENDGDDNIESGGASEHTCKYNSEILVNPTCTDKGTTKYSCACGNSYTLDDIPKLTHSYEEESRTPATCTSTGTVISKCIHCGDTIETTLDKLPHEFEDGFCKNDCGTGDGTVVETAVAAYVAKSQGQTFQLRNPEDSGVTYSLSDTSNMSLNNDIVTVNNSAPIGTIVPITATKSDNSSYTINMIVAPDVDNGYYAIYNSNDLVTLGIIASKNALNDVNQNAKLMNSIDLSDVCSEEKGNWTPIGTYVGIFDGQDYTINNLYANVTSSKMYYLGLFSYANNATIKNLTLNGKLIANVSNSATAYTGAFCGFGNNTTLENLTNNCTINALTSTNGYTGGIAGYGSAINCTNNVQITSSSKYVGGIVGRGYASDSINNGYVYTGSYKSATYIGGIVGEGSATRCMNLGNVYNGAESNPNIGGICGISTGKVTECVNKGQVNAYSTVTGATGLCAGGIVGNQSRGNIENCYNLGEVRGGHQIGGITGLCQYKIINSYNCGTVYGTSTGSIAGGILGTINTTTSNGGSHVYQLSTAKVSRNGTSSTITLHGNKAIGNFSGSGIYGAALDRFTNCGLVDSDTLKTYASVLGDAFTDDVNNINNGYPILKWQLEE